MKNISLVVGPTLTLSFEHGIFVLRPKKDIIVNVQMAREFVDILLHLSQSIGRNIPLCAIISGALGVLPDARLHVRSRVGDFQLVGLAFVVNNKSQEIMMKFTEMQLELFHYEKSFHDTLEEAKKWLTKRCEEEGVELVKLAEAEAAFKTLVY